MFKKLLIFITFIFFNQYSYSFSNISQEKLSSYDYYLESDIYLNGEEKDLNPSLAFNLLNQGITINPPHPQTQYQLGLMYEYWFLWHPHYNDSKKHILYSYYYSIFGYSIEPIYEKSFNLYYLSATNNKSHVVPAVYGSLGKSYLLGLGTYRNKENAFLYFMIGEYYGDWLSYSYMQHIDDYLFPYQQTSAK